MKPIRVSVIILISASFSFLIFLPRPYIKQTDQINITQPLPDLPKLQSYPVKSENAQNPPEISARSAIIIDSKTSAILFEKEPNLRVLPASTTKLMTAIVALEKCEPDAIVDISYIKKEPNSMGLEVGDQLKVESLLYGLLIFSANDAAYALATNCARTYEEFVYEMNQKAVEFGMENTYFADPAGFDHPAHFSTAKDLAKLVKVAVANPIIAKIVSTKSTSVTDARNNKIFKLENTNHLLGEVDGVLGVKTGQTEGSGEILLAETQRNGNSIITVVLGSQDRFSDSKNLIEWVFKNHQWLSP